MKTSLSPQRKKALTALVEKTVCTTPVYDIHTHLYDPAFGSLLLWGIDDLLTYHYLVAEAFRQMPMRYDQFWTLSKTEQANVIWSALFIEHSPVSEACRGVLTTLNQLGISPKKRDLPALRKWFASWTKEDYTTRCMEAAGVRTICMTNSPFDDVERPVWKRGFHRDPRFTAALRIDPLLLFWPDTAQKLAVWGYKTAKNITPKTISEVRRFLEDWSRKIDARYLMVSLPPDFDHPASGDCDRLLTEAVLPHARDHGLPLAVMLGVKRGINPKLRLAGDGVGLSKMSALENLCAGFPENKFLATALSRENQHTLCVIARKFRNLHPFGCWWFTNIPGQIEEITRMRLELLGPSFTAQHSDARVLDQIVYKWRHSRQVISKVLTEKYIDLAITGWEPQAKEIQRDVSDLFGGAFEKFCSSPIR
jgi:hypothetical protein